MGPILYCDRCRMIEVGWNRTYGVHRVVCGGWLPTTLTLLVYAGVVSLAVFLLPTTAGVVAPEQSASGVASAAFVASDNAGAADYDGPGTPGAPGAVVISDPSVFSIESLLVRNSRLNASQRARVATSVVASARKYDVDPYLISSILLVESSGNPYAISGRGAVGIMQIHVPTWDELVEEEGINLFRVEENIDLGTRILSNYIGRFGLWDGVMRYLGAGGPTEEAITYLSRVQDIYTDRVAD